MRAPTRGRVLAGVAASVAVGMVLGLPSAPGDTDGPAARPTPPSRGAANKVSPADDPAAAAVAFVAATDQLVAQGPIGRRELLRDLVAEQSLAEQVDSVEAELAAMEDKLRTPENLRLHPARLVWVEAPLRVSVQRHPGPTRARARVWTLSVFGAPELGPPQAAWRTVTLELVWGGDRWLVEEARAEAGPTPASGELALPDGFGSFAQAASWTPVARGGR